MERPLLSIVIPTRERGEVLQHTLRTVLALPDPRFEIIVCDNASTDGTAEVVKSFPDPRLRYSRSETRLTMPENFARGLDLATGDYVMTLGDDDLIIGENLTIALDCALQRGTELIFWHRAYFYWGSFPEPSLAGSFAIPNGRGTFPVDGPTLLSVSYRGFISYQYLPCIYNSLCKRTFLDKYRNYLRGRWFPDYVISPDVFSSLVFPSLSPTVRFLQSPASISGISHRSNGMSLLTGGAEFTRFIEELGYGEHGCILPDQFKGKLKALTSEAVMTLNILTDYVNVATRLLAYSHPNPPPIEQRVRDSLHRLLDGGHIELDGSPDGFGADEEYAPVQEDVLTYFFQLWSIPFPQSYAGKFSSDTASVVDLHLHLTSTGYNKAPVQ